MERVLADIDADDGDFATVFLGHGVLLCLRCPSPAWTTGRVGARPDHPISGSRLCVAAFGMTWAILVLRPHQTRLRPSHLHSNSLLVADTQPEAFVVRWAIEVVLVRLRNQACRRTGPLRPLGFQRKQIRAIPPRGARRLWSPTSAL